MSHVYLSVLGLFGLLSIAVLMLPAARKLNFPYTVMVALIGIIIGVVIMLSTELTPAAHEGLHGIPVIGEILLALGSFEVTSEVILFVFLPALVFESALAIDVRRLIDDIAPILLLAIVGVLISTALVGGTMTTITGFSLVTCLLLGAIVSATDPVAVVAIFKDLSVPHRLGILVEGESLFNDATAIVMFNILLAMILGLAQADVVGGALSFAEVFVGGVIVGYLLARATCWLIGQLRNQTIVEITLTISLAYIAFILAEHFLHVSGVMATLTAGLVMGSVGRKRISGDSWEMLGETWENIGFWANSLIFIMVGMAVPMIMQDISWAALATMATLIVVATLARSVLIFGLIPGVQYLGLTANLTTGYKAVMLWGGLRGAVSLALALAISENPAVDSETQQFIITMVTGFVLFTLFVNATTIRFLMRAFKLDELPIADQVVQNRAMINAIADVNAQISDFAKNHQIDDRIVGPLNREYEARIHFLKEDIEKLGTLSDEDWLRVGLSAIYAHEKQIYLDLYREGFLLSHTAQVLTGYVDDLGDGLRHSGSEGYRNSIHYITRFPQTFLLALLAHRRLRLTYWLSNALANRFELLRSCQAAIDELQKEYVERVGQIVGADTAASITDMLKERAKNIEQALAALRSQYPDYAQRMKERSLGQVAVRVEREDYAQMQEDGIISNDVYRALDGHLESTAKKFGRRPALDLGLRPIELVGRVPLFTNLSATDQAEIASMLKPRLAIPGEMICHKGDMGHHMYFISSGTLDVVLEQGNI